MKKESKRYLFIGQFHPSFLGLFSAKGQVIWVTSHREAFNQTGSFTVIMIDPKSFSSKYYQELSKHYPKTPIIVDSADKPADPPPFVRFVPFKNLLSNQIEKEEKLASTELKVEELRQIHQESKEVHKIETAFIGLLFEIPGLFWWKVDD